MKNPFRKSGASADISAELSRLTAKRAETEHRLDVKLQELESAKATRLEVLDGDDATIAKATAEVRTAQAVVQETRDLIADFDKAIEAAQDRLSTATDRERREGEAKRVEKAIAGIEKRRPELEKAMAALAAAAKSMIKEIPLGIGIAPGVYLFRREDKRGYRAPHPLSGQEAVYAAIVDGICEALPDIEESFYVDGRRQSCLVRLVDVDKPSYGAYDGVPAALPVGEALDKILLGRLKAQVAAILAGDDERDRLSISPPPPPEPEKEPVEEVEIFATADFSFVGDVNAMGRPVRQIVAYWTRRSVPVPVAAAAVRAAVAHRMDSPQGYNAWQREQERLALPFVSHRDASPTFDMCEDLGDPMDLVRIWREEHGRGEEAEEAARAVG